MLLYFRPHSMSIARKELGDNSTSGSIAELIRSAISLFVMVILLSQELLNGKLLVNDHYEQRN